MPDLPGIRLYVGHSGSGLSRVSAEPYWAFPWAGGLALARFIGDHPDLFLGRRVLDLGAGGGIVAIAAAKAGAAVVMACEIDPYGVNALQLNAAANDVEMTVIDADLMMLEPLAVDLVLAGDLFYEAGLALRTERYLARCHAAGSGVLVGDPGRAPLPTARLRPVATYDVRDFGDGEPKQSTVYVFS